MIFKNVCPIIVDTFLLNGGLYQIIFRLRFWVWWVVTGVYSHYSEVLAGIVARHIEMIPHRMIFRLGVC